MDRFEKWLDEEISKAKAALKESLSKPDEDGLVEGYKCTLENYERTKISAYRYALENYERLKGDEPCENEPCDQEMDYRDTLEYLTKCRSAIERVREYVMDKISMDKQDKQLITNPNAYIEKCGALNALHDIDDLIKRCM